MSEKKVLVPVDFSAQSEAALQYATAFAKELEAELLILHVMDAESPTVAGLEPEDARIGLYKALHAIQPNDDSVRFAHQLVQGTPADAILRTAEEEKVEMIVMGTHGRAGLKRLVLGSVAEEVVRRAPCPILTLREPLPPTAAEKVE